MANSLPSFPAFDLNDDLNSSVRWKKWLQRFENFIVVLDVKDDTRKRAMLLHYAGEGVQDVFDTLADTGEAKDYAKAKERLSEYFAPKINVTYETYKFRQAKQLAGESLDSYHTRLKQLAATCDFTDNDREIKTMIIQTCTCNKLRRQALQKPEMTLTELLTLGRMMALAESQASGMEHAQSPAQENPREDVLAMDMRRMSIKKKCYNCSGTFPHREQPCPARGKTCDSCGKLNHFAKCCRSKRPQGGSRRQEVHYMQHTDTAKGPNSNRPNAGMELTEDSEYLYTVSETKANLPHASIKVGDSNVKVMIDTGASVNIIDETTFRRLKCRPSLTKCTISIFPYGSRTPLPALGKFTAMVESKSQLTTATFHVLKGNNGSLLGYGTASQLGLIKIANALHMSPQQHDQLQGSHSTDSQRASACIKTDGNTIDDILSEYNDLFQGMGKLKDVQVKLHIKKDVTPVTQPHRRVPFHVRKRIEAELQRLEDLDVIEKVNGPTPWVSPIVAVPKPKDPDAVRICVDMRVPNQAIERERHLTPTVDDVIQALNGAKFFSKLDLNSGYHQLEVEPSSRYITTFSTHVGLRRYKRLSFGVSSAAEVFQNAIQQALDGIPGVINLSDDILVFGGTRAAHDQALKATFQRLREKNLTLNKAKCSYAQTTLDFFGYTFSDGGFSPDPKKVQALHDAPAPTNAGEVRSLLGMANYSARFIKDFATITQPLRDLTKKSARWDWTEEHDRSLGELKRSLTCDAVMTYFDPHKLTELVVDASPVGLGAVLAQRNSPQEPARVISYASRALSPIEQKYSQTEREALAIVWGCEHFHMYLYGAPFTLVSDHKPLEWIFNNPKSKPPARIERWSLRLQPYNYTVCYKAGKDNPADYMSRHPAQVSHISNITTVNGRRAEEYVNFVAANAVPKAMTLVEIQDATKNDPTLREVIRLIKDGSWRSLSGKQSVTEGVDGSTLMAFKRIKDELTVTVDEDIVLRGTRIVIPHSLQCRAVSLAHEGHQGIVKTKNLIREKVWFPGIDRQVEHMIAGCIPCQANVPVHTQEPLCMSDLPSSPWEKVSVDFCGPFPSGDYLLVVVDEYSRFPEVEILQSTSARATIPKLDKIFSTHGIPLQVKTDNGPPFQSSEFADFATYLGFTHRKITPLWPQANAEAERFMRTLEKTIRAAHVEGHPWKQTLYAFLRNYRATPHCSTGMPPADVLYGGRPIRIKLPAAPPPSQSQTDVKLRRADDMAKDRMKHYAEMRRHVAPLALTIGDKVLCRQKKDGKLCPVYNPRPYKIIAIKGSMITAKRNDHIITRNSSHFKKLPDADHHSQSRTMDDMQGVMDWTEINPQQPPELAHPDSPRPQPPLQRYPVRENRRPPSYLNDFEFE